MLSNELMQNVIFDLLEASDLKLTELTKAAGAKPGEVVAWVANPGSMTFDNLAQLTRGLGLPPAGIIEAWVEALRSSEAS